MIVLGIADSFTSGAAIIVDGRIVAAVNEERLDRNKMSWGFPALSIAEVMRVAGVEPADIDIVAVATANLFWRERALPYVDYFREKKAGAHQNFLDIGANLSTLVGDIGAARKVYYQLKKTLTRKRRAELPRVLRESFGIQAPVKFLDHHLCHAASAYFTSGFERATVITQDGAGDGKCSRAYRVTDGRFEQLNMLDSYDSVGNYYAYVTHLCGFKAHKHEGKITGLAAYGKPVYLDLLKDYVEFGEGEIHNTGRCFDHSAIKKLERDLPKDFSKEDLSASVQVLLEEAVGTYSRHWVDRAGYKDVALAGGVFANVKLNQRIHELNNVDRIFVHPGMGDDGLAVGAALFEHAHRCGYQHEPVMQHAYLGPDISDREILEACQKAGLQIVDCEHGVERKTAELLAAGKVLARCAGRMEYGPRALGNRSILYQATDPTVNNWLNERLSRTEFMPFAPVTLWESRHDCFKAIDGAEETARFMTITFDCTESMKKESPAVCHIDGTARPQLIREEDNPRYYRILQEYKQLTGIPSLINTSFNMHEEPIVATAGQAVESFLRSGLDAILLGSHLAVKADANESADASRTVAGGA